jgi:protein O-GlcNAc transferase
MLKWLQNSIGRKTAAAQEAPPPVSAEQVKQWMKDGFAHFQAGNAGAAWGLFEKILQQQPEHSDALYLSGVLLSGQGRNREAAPLIERAIAADGSVASFHFTLGNVLRVLGEEAKAQARFVAAVGLDPDDADFHNALACSLHQSGKSEEALEHFRHALRLAPNAAQIHNNFGIVLQALGQNDAAAQSYRNALALDPENADAECNLGATYYAQRRTEEAVACFRRALQIRPAFTEAHSNLGNALRDLDQWEAAAASYLRALELQPDAADTHNNLGVVLKELGRLDEAVASFRRAAELKPYVAEAHNILGCTLGEIGQHNEAAASFRRAVEIQPDFVEAYCNLGLALKELGRFDEAVASLRHALALKPDLAEAHLNLGNVLKDLGQQDDAATCYHRALQLKPDYADAYSSLLFLHGYHASLAPDTYLAIARAWELACVPVHARQQAHGRIFHRAPLAVRRLRVGYVSGDFYRHAVSYFIEQLFAHHDRSRVELFAYYAYRQQDAVTDRLRALVDHWIPVAGMPDAMVLNRIGADEIDVLIDLSGHTAHNRMGVFARRAAPVQAHYLGYFASTGLTEMDYMIGDEIITPPATDSHFCEKIWRLPRIRASYDGTTDAPLPRWHPAPDGKAWLGSFNNLGKITAQTVALWARVLHALPEGRLLLKTNELAEAGNRQRILDAFGSQGIPAERIELRDRSVTPGWREHMAYYDRLDIVLDSIGAHGGYTTTCDALWMGVPVIALEGDRMATRMAGSILNAIGHPEWVARTEAEYVEKVVALARDVEQRKIFRADQRERMGASPLCDAKDLAMSIEDAYFEMFERWAALPGSGRPLG